MGFVYERQKHVTQFLTEKFPHVQSVHYFSDGCASQYKKSLKIYAITIKISTWKHSGIICYKSQEISVIE